MHIENVLKFPFYQFLHKIALIKVKTDIINNDKI